jgi:hypothetical protein
LTVIDDILYFNAQDTLHGRELWKYPSVAGNTMGINETDFANSVVMYPNPANGVFIIELKDCKDTYELIITDILGKTVLVQKNQYVKSEIYLSKQVNGTYFVQLKTKTGSVTKKLTINR